MFSLDLPMNLKSLFSQEAPFTKIELPLPVNIFNEKQPSPQPLTWLNKHFTTINQQLQEDHNIEQIGFGEET